MYADMQKLKGKIVERNRTQEGIADDIFMDRSTFYRKMKNGKFTINDIHKMCKSIPLSKQEAIDIFLIEK